MPVIKWAPLMNAIGELGAFLARESAAAAPSPQPVTTVNGGLLECSVR